VQDPADEKSNILTHFPNVQSCADGALEASVYILCIDKLLKEFEKIFKGFQNMKFTVSFITNPFQETDISESGAIISSVLQENISTKELIDNGASATRH
jgi:hypothetical protein